MLFSSLPQELISIGLELSQIIIVKGEYIQGTDNHDELRGSSGNDLIETHGHVDWITWSPGQDIIDGGAGDLDTLSYEGFDQPISVTLNGSEGAAVFVGEFTGLATPSPEKTSKDIIRNIECVVGGNKSDWLVGDDGHNRLYGGPGEDILIGGRGPDYFGYLRVPTQKPATADAILDFNRDDSDRIELLNISADVGQHLMFVGERTPGKHPGPYTVSYERGVDPHNNPLRKFDFGSEGLNSLYREDNGLSLWINYGEDTEDLLITVWGVDDFQPSDFIV